MISPTTDPDKHLDAERTRDAAIARKERNCVSPCRFHLVDAGDLV